MGRLRNQCDLLFHSIDHVVYAADHGGNPWRHSVSAHQRIHCLCRRMWRLPEFLNQDDFSTKRLRLAATRGNRREPIHMDAARAARSPAGADLRRGAAQRVHRGEARVCARRGLARLAVARPLAPARDRQIGDWCVTRRLFGRGDCEARPRLSPCHGRFVRTGRTAGNRDREGRLPAARLLPRTTLRARMVHASRCTGCCPLARSAGGDCF